MTMNISWLYLIETKIVDGGRKVYKYGLTKNLSELMLDVSLDTYIVIPELALSSAESEFRKSVSDYHFEYEGETELISLSDDAHKDVKTIFRIISDKYCGNYQAMISDIKHGYDVSIAVKDKEIEMLREQIQMLMTMRS